MFHGMKGVSLSSSTDHHNLLVSLLASSFPYALLLLFEARSIGRREKKIDLWFSCWT